MNRTDPPYVTPDKGRKTEAVNPKEEIPIPPTEGEEDNPLQSSSDVDMLRRVRDLLTETA